MVELLAPAGDFESLKAAVINGANAVYIGGKEFSARQYAGNFDRQEIIDAVRFSHAYDVKVYVTLNTLLKNEELNDALNYAAFLYESGVDAIIVQDIGFLKLLKEILPEFEVHASTQMSVNNLDGVNHLYSLGVKRVVLARELSLSEIEYICKNTQAEIEVFIHGALCICFSGQCLFSSMIGGRSGNRGRCAQPCRMQYSLEGGEKSYILSPKDLWTIEHIDKLIKAGVKSLKIEGRMKRPEYVATVVSSYRKAIDNGLDEEDKKNIMSIFNRGGFTTAYLFENQGPEMMSYQNPKNWGTALGKVLDKKGKFVIIKLEDKLNLGDGIEIFGTGKGVPVNKIYKNGKEVESANRGDEVKIYFEEAKKGDKIYKTQDIKLIERARESFEGKCIKKVPINGCFKADLEKVVLTIKKDDVEVKVLGEAPQRAISKPTTREKVIESLSKTKDTPFYFEDLEVEMQEGLMIPISQINELRRSAIEKLLDKLQNKKQRVDININFSKNKKEIIPKVAVKTGRIDVARAAIEAGADIVFFGGDRLRINSKDIEGLIQHKEKIAPYFSEIIIEEFDALKQRAKELKSKGFNCALCGNIGFYKALKEIEYDVYLDKGFNIFNSFSVDLFENKAALISYELNIKEIKNLIENTKGNTMITVYGRTKLMVSRYCPIGSSKGYNRETCPNVCNNKIHYLKDRMGEKFPIATDIYCRSHIYNSKKTIVLEHIKDLLSLNSDYWVLEFLDEDAHDVKNIVSAYKDAISRGIKGDFTLSQLAIGILEKNKNDITKGHFYRGVQ
ncbi:putative protease YhbU precursor [Caloramator mitchellensis]|uniref:Putative protease YhbU n=1 Tax=Caloramator mitchellensis TaxID=908809 RepID=A0A0R3K1R8_CALMK|nr:DUF3656 domain-containing protein [Caloramator mitchellensis]KRQ87348.1 putative protease YhbU precursor [Caloramator mitchellensis]